MCRSKRKWCCNHSPMEDNALMWMFECWETFCNPFLSFSISYKHMNTHGMYELRRGRKSIKNKVGRMTRSQKFYAEPLVQNHLTINSVFALQAKHLIAWKNFEEDSLISNIILTTRPLCNGSSMLTITVVLLMLNATSQPTKRPMPMIDGVANFVCYFVEFISRYLPLGRREDTPSARRYLNRISIIECCWPMMVNVVSSVEMFR